MEFPDVIEFANQFIDNGQEWKVRVDVSNVSGDAFTSTLTFPCFQTFGNMRYQYVSKIMKYEEV